MAHHSEPVCFTDHARSNPIRAAATIPIASSPRLWICPAANRIERTVAAGQKPIPCVSANSRYPRVRYSSVNPTNKNKTAWMPANRSATIPVIASPSKCKTRKRISSAINRLIERKPQRRPTANRFKPPIGAKPYIQRGLRSTKRVTIQELNTDARAAKAYMRMVRVRLSSPRVDLRTAGKTAATHTANSKRNRRMRHPARSRPVAKNASWLS